MLQQRFFKKNTSNSFTDDVAELRSLSRSAGPRAMAASSSTIRILTEQAFAFASSLS
jgi:hypothetical protein